MMIFIIDAKQCMVAWYHVENYLDVKIPHVFKLNNCLFRNMVDR